MLYAFVDCVHETKKKTTEVKGMRTTREELKEYIAIADDGSLAEEPGMVYQVWEDGEITLQKSGEILWQRSLHMVERGHIKNRIDMPHKSGEHSYIFCTRDDAYLIRAEIFNLQD